MQHLLLLLLPLLALYRYLWELQGKMLPNKMLPNRALLALLMVVVGGACVGWDRKQ